MKRIYKICLFVVLFLTCSAVLLQAQGIKVSGMISSVEEPSGLPGVNIMIKGTTQGTTTDFDGNFTLEVPSSSSVLIFSSTGLKSQEITVGDRTVFDIKLETDTKTLAEIVVTALGYEEDPDVLGSTSSKVEGVSIARSGEAQLVNGISGRAAGVLVNRSAGDPGAGSYIQIRGQSTITGNSQPLIVVDGIPISNSSQDDSPNVSGNTSGGVVQQSRMNDINPNDVESMQILKGASAAALWGSRAANGVIIITTKKGRKKSGINVSYKSSYSIDQINVFHEKQTKYGQGFNGAYNPNGAQSWGDKISDRSGAADVVDESGEFFEGGITGTRYYPILSKNETTVYDPSNYDQLFQDGQTFDNNISISGADDKGSSFFFSLGHLDQEGIYTSNSDYKRTSIRFNTVKEFNKVVKMSTNAMYTASSSNRVQRGNNTAGAIVAYLRTPPDFDVTDYIGNYYSSATAAPIEGRQRSYRRYLANTAHPVYNNPLWTLYQQQNLSDVDRFIVSSEIKLKPVQWFELTTRGGVDSYIDERVGFFPINEVIGGANGSFSQQLTKETQLNLDVIGRANAELAPEIHGSLVLGFNINNRKYLNLMSSLSNFLIANNPPLSVDNAEPTNRTPYNFISEIRTARAYSTANISAFDMAFLNLSLAAESTSTFGDLTDNTFYYPAADLAVIFTQIDALSALPALSFGKLRASYGVVGVQPEPYRTATDYVTTSFSNTPWGDVLTGAGYGGAYIQGSEKGDPYLKPEQKTEFELGTDLRFINHKLSMSFTYYQNKTEDLLLPIPVASSSGFLSKYTNAGTLENKGIELDMGYDIVSSRDLLINVYGNFNRNRNEVTDLAGTEFVSLAGIDGFIESGAAEGYPVGVLWNGRYARTEGGEIILDANGFPTIDESSGVIGDPNPHWRGGAGINASYKGFGLNVLFETSQGNDLYSGTAGVMYSFGTHADNGNEVTLTEDLVNYAGATIPAGSTVRGNIVDFGAGPVLLDQSYYTTLGSGFGALKEQFIYDASWTRLRELTLSYNLSSEGFRERTKLESVTFSVTGRNLWLMTDMIGVDPETNLTGTSTGRGMDYFNSPGTRSFIFTLTVNY